MVCPLGKPRLSRRTPSDGWALSADGKLIATITTAIYVWDSATGWPLRQIPLSDKRGGGLTFSPDGDLLAAGKDTSVLVVELRTGRTMLNSSNTSPGSNQ